ncbi:hypothetical protein K438DRAFT_1811964, partial [Mycena galopus ATCC 62051]
DLPLSKLYSNALLSTLNARAALGTIFRLALGPVTRHAHGATRGDSWEAERKMRITGTGRSTGTMPPLRHAACSRNPASASSFPNTPLLLPAVGPSHCIHPVSLCYPTSYPIACTYRRIQHPSSSSRLVVYRSASRITHSSSIPVIHSPPRSGLWYPAYPPSIPYPISQPTTIDCHGHGASHDGPSRRLRLLGSPSAGSMQRVTRPRRRGLAWMHSRAALGGA